MYKRWLLLAIALSLMVSNRAMALLPDELALVVNKNNPAGRRLAEFYAAQRKVPDGRIIELNLPDEEEMPFYLYEREVVPPMRAAIRERGLENKVKCLVTFWGVPLRISARPAPTPRERTEIAELQQEQAKLIRQLTPLVDSMEEMALEADTAFTPAKPPSALPPSEQLIYRNQAAGETIARYVRDNPTSPRREPLIDRQLVLLEQIVGKQATLQRALRRAAGTGPTTLPTSLPSVSAIREQLQNADLQLRKTEQARFDPDARAELRRIVRDNFGLLVYSRLLRSQIDYFGQTETGAAFDSELALMWLPGYPHERWAANPLSYAARARSASHVVMVMRLDGPDKQTVHRLIESSIKAEQEGLHGKVVLDSQGLKNYPLASGSDKAKSAYDAGIRSLADLLKAKTQLQVVFDDKADVLPSHSANDVAAYCGWYSLRNYIPACDFNPGAVGFHIASYEMLSLHNGGETGWCRNLLKDGVAATLGPVNEPYLQAFPQAEDFFTLLFTGKLTLAEVYWATTPMTSWMMTAVGDPLYTPYRTNPALKVEDVPERLKSAFKQ